MTRSGTLHTLTAVIVALSLPTGLSLLWHHLSGDPMMRPLGITRDALQRTGQYDGLTIYAYVTWDPEDPDAPDQDAFVSALKNGFSAKGVEVLVKPRNGSSGSTVTYEIGPSTIGPMPIGSAVKGINAAVAAYRMNVPTEN